MKKEINYHTCSFFASVQVVLLAFLLLPIVAKASTQNNKYEAENSIVTDGEIFWDSKYSGGKGVKVTELTSLMVFKFTLASQQSCKVYVAAEGIGGEKTIKCDVNGTVSKFKAYSYGEVEVGNFTCPAGQNTITIMPSYTWYIIDYIRIESTQTSITFDLPSSPITPNATASACALYTFLKNNFGTRTISGIMTGDLDGISGKNIKQQADVQAVYQASGHYPALVGFDFTYTTGLDVDKGSDVYKTYTAKVISLAEDLWAQGGIPDFTWHWRDPSRATFKFYTESVTLNFATALKTNGAWDTTSPLYQNMIKDIDAVADCFLQLQAKGVACIFRPLHEANGAWFWWGTQGAEAYCKLYQLIYNEMVNVKGVRNVIWDWNADYAQSYTSATQWCPGSAYFDIISTDIYNSDFDYSCNYLAFDKLKELTNGKNIIALAEVGPVPDIADAATHNALWAWWMPWYQTWNGGYVDKTSKAEWIKVMADARIITLEDMPGWDAYSGIVSPETSPSVSAAYDLQGIRLPKPQKGRINILNGQKVWVK